MHLYSVVNVLFWQPGWPPAIDHQRASHLTADGPCPTTTSPISG